MRRIEGSRSDRRRSRNKRQVNRIRCFKENERASKEKVKLNAWPVYFVCRPPKNQPRFKDGHYRMHVRYSNGSEKFLSR